jgi:hypothetical protein
MQVFEEIDGKSSRHAERQQKLFQFERFRSILVGYPKAQTFYG